jgi:molecular chaperone GrpE
MSPKQKKEKQEDKVAALEATLEDEKKKAETYLNQLKYAKADLENLQKRTQKLIGEAMDRSNGRLLLQLLPILDELELAVAAADTTDGNIVEGIRMVKGKLEKLMEAEGVSPIKAVGEPFNPRLHEAVLEEKTSDHPDGYITEEIMKGYTYKDRVLRASMVKVARNKSSKEVKEEIDDE